jgi:hypothetical protein
LPRPPSPWPQPACRWEASLQQNTWQQSRQLYDDRVPFEAQNGGPSVYEHYRDDYRHNGYGGDVWSPWRDVPPQPFQEMKFIPHSQAMRHLERLLELKREPSEAADKTTRATLSRKEEMLKDVITENRWQMRRFERDVGLGNYLWILGPAKQVLPPALYDRIDDWKRKRNAIGSHEDDGITYGPTSARKVLDLAQEVFTVVSGIQIDNVVSIQFQ